MMLIELMVVKYLGGEPSGVALKRHFIIHQLIGMVWKFDVSLVFGMDQGRFGRTRNRMVQKLCSISGVN